MNNLNQFSNEIKNCVRKNIKYICRVTTKKIMARFPINVLKKWFKRFERYKVSYKKGCYHLASLAHSPQTIIESFDKMPFCKHDRSMKSIISDTMFLKCKMYYHYLEDDFCLMTSNLEFKKNIMMQNIYDKNLPVEYHFINIHIKAKTVVNKSLVNGLVLKDRTWTLFKAGQALTEYHFKNSLEKNITLFFTTKWFKKQVVNSASQQSADNLIDFFNSTNNYLILDEANPIYESIFENMMELADDNKDDKNTTKIKALSNLVLTNFINKLNTEIISENHFDLTDIDRKNIQRTEALLLNNLLGPFPGIEKLASEVGISPTKLKKDFKSYHNKSIYHYFSEHQMQLAHKMLHMKKHTVRETATMLGYENSSKFSTRFKSIYQFSPSEILSSKS